MNITGAELVSVTPIENAEAIRPAVKLELYRRHTNTCPDREKGRNWLKCSGKRPCPLYCDGTVDGKRVRRSLGRDLGRAEKRIAMMEDSRGVAGAGRDHSLARMVKIYLDTCRQKKLADSTLRRYTRTLNQMVAYTGPDPALSSPTFLDTLTQFRASMRWDKANTVRGNTVCLRSFFNWAHKRGWISKNWSSLLDLPEAPGGQTEPFTEVEIGKLLRACGRLSQGGGRADEEIRTRARAFLMALLYTGLRISDVVRLNREQISGGKLLMSMQKTGEPIYLRLQPALLAALAALPESHNLRPGHYFWSHGSTHDTQCGSWRRTLHRLEKYAGIAVIRPHRFRDTLAKTVLDNGYPLSTVQKLLGHTDIRTTERYYAHFSSEQQRIMDEAMASLHFEKRPSQPRAHARRNRRRNAQRNVISFSTSA